VSTVELYGAASCPHTQELREWLEMRGTAFTEYDIEADAEARQRMREITNAPYAVPVLVRDGSVVQIGWQGRSCPIG
jgi:glutaredoxin 3